MNDWLVFAAAVLVPLIGVGATYFKARLDSNDLRSQLTTDMELLNKVPDTWSSKPALQASIERRIGEIANPPIGWGLGSSWGVLLIGEVFGVAGTLGIMGSLPGLPDDLSDDARNVVIIASACVYSAGGAIMAFAVFQLLRRRQHEARSTPRP
ncbi:MULTISPECIES: hypothetical protein [unclassified Rhodococcus (in: high G+C Gram-positive bacteria)]|uniref:hypothetical protein n=1 Tax=unclassified Rhodococcus (in: high G+C Gram-positive bacteria) TaxID=192944 RepID=UPI0007017231|nr:MULTISPECIES: hypothetical protein [unclassified Rhodococcus (in: high G+C Gram-positive bacteria)]KQU30359.1 hypothetical protein ASG69_04695 [Rhodococcus sp. Leaf225]KQU44736.1 hypothetical protein ASH03_12445 [Rhodococcus sp. Leaf258]